MKISNKLFNNIKTIKFKPITENKISFSINKIPLKNFSSFSPKKIVHMKELTNKYNNYIFDMDGIIWRGKEYLTNTINFIKYLKSKDNKRVFFLTNTTLSTRVDLQKKLKKGNLIIEDSKTIYTSSYLLASFINSEYKDLKSIYVIGREGLINELKNFGIKVHGGFEDDFKKLELYDAGGIEIDPSIQGVAVAFDNEINYYKMFYANQIINNTGIFFGTNIDKNLVIGGRRVPAGYSIISALETSSERKALIISKPDPRSLRIIFNDYQIEYSEEELSKTLMIGDNLMTDIKFANNAKIDSLLSLTGVTNYEQLKSINFEENVFGKPTYYTEEIKI